MPSAMTPQPIDRLLRLEAVEEIVGLKRTMIYRLIRRGEFPRQYKPGGYASRWSEGEVLAWREGQRQQRMSAESG